MLTVVLCPLVVEVLKRPRWEDYEIEYVHKNPWASLGMGFDFADKAEDRSKVDFSKYLQEENIDPQWLAAVQQGPIGGS